MWRSHESSSLLGLLVDTLPIFSVTLFSCLPELHYKSEINCSGGFFFSLLKGSSKVFLGLSVRVKNVRCYQTCFFVSICSFMYYQYLVFRLKYNMQNSSNLCACYKLMCYLEPLSNSQSKYNFLSLRATGQILLKSFLAFDKEEQYALLIQGGVVCGFRGVRLLNFFLKKIAYQSSLYCLKSCHVC